MNDDEQKLFGGLYDSIEDSAIGKFFDLSGEKKAAYDQAVREGKFGVVSKNLQKVVDVIQTGIGKAMTPVTKGIELVSDVTNVDERAVSDSLEALFYGRGLVKKLPKIKTPERFKPVNKRTVDVKATRVEDAKLTGDYTSTAEIPDIVAQSPRVPRKVDLANIKALKNKLNNKPFTFQDVAGDATDKQIMQAYRERTGELQLNPNITPRPAPPSTDKPIVEQKIDATDLPDAVDTAAMTTYYNQEAEIKKALSLEQTKSRNLSLYGADPDIFEEVNSLRDAMNMPAMRGGRFVKMGKDYFTVFTRGGRQQVLPYNKWYAKNVNPFMVPKQLLNKLKKFEAGQQGDLLKVSKKNPAGVPTIKVPYGTQGKFGEVVPPTKYDKGTVDEFNNWYKDIFKLQKEEQALNRQISVMLEKLGNIEARNPGKKVFDTDLSHIAPRSKGGSGLTFQEAWILNQQRGADNILDDNVLAAAGIPKNWEELFYYWLAQKKPGRELQTAIGPLSQINVDDYFALSKGEALNVVGKRRKDIRNMVNRQIGNPDQYRMPGKRGTFQDDFEAAVRASKAGQVGGDIFLNDKLLDIRWVAENFDGLLEIGDI